jgi:chromosome segregation ATPase
MTTTTHPSLATALDAQIEALQERIRLIRKQLHTSAEDVERTMRAIRGTDSAHEQANERADANDFQRIATWQARLDEVLRAYGALSALRANYSIEISAVSGPARGEA